MNDKARLKFLDRLERSADLTVSEAAFIESLADADTLTDAQRQRVDALHARHKEKSASRKPAVKRDPFVPFRRDADVEAKVNPCRRAGHRPVAGRLAAPPEAPWQCWCACGMTSAATAEGVVAQWNAFHPAAQTEAAK